MPRLALALLLGLAALPACTSGPAAHDGAAAERVHLVVLHTNDVHGQVLPRAATWVDTDDPPSVGGLARVAAYVNRVRAEVQESGGALLVVDGGDWFQGTPEGMIEDGRPFLMAMGEVGYDAMCVGNHEFDHGVDVLEAHLAAAELPAILANVSHGNGAGVAGTQPYRVVESGGLRVALVGLLTVETPKITHHSTRSLSFASPGAALAALRAELEPVVDWILPVTHLAVDEASELARAHPDLDLIVSGHSHSYLKEGVRVGDTLVVQAGSKASAVGRVDLWFDGSTKEVVEMRAQLVDLYDAPEEPFANRAVEAHSEHLVAASAELMDEVVGFLTVPLSRTRDPVGVSTAGNLITDAMRARARADVALQNRGGIRANLPAGEVTRRDLFQILPFGNHLVTLTLTGAGLEELLRQSLKGHGLEFSGMQVEVSRAGEAYELARILVGGEPLDRERRYRVVTNSFTAGGGDGFMVLEQASEREADPILLREMLEAYFRTKDDVTPDAESRYVVIQ